MTAALLAAGAALGAPARDASPLQLSDTQPIQLEARSSDFEPAPSPATELLVGRAYHDGYRLIEEPMSFARKNYVSLRELQRAIQTNLVDRHDLLDAADNGIGVVDVRAAGDRAAAHGDDVARLHAAGQPAAQGRGQHHGRGHGH